MSRKVVTLSIAQTLPDEHLRRIGEIVVAWTVAETKLSNIVFMLLGVSVAQGRLAVRSARAKEMIELISDLAMAGGHRVTFTDVASIEEIENRRNKIVHGTWFDDGKGGYLLQELRGRMPLAGHPGVKINKRILPAGVPIKTDDLTDLLDSIRATIESIDDVGKRIGALLKTSDRKRREPHPSDETPGRN